MRNKNKFVKFHETHLAEIQIHLIICKSYAMRLFRTDKNDMDYELCERQVSTHLHCSTPYWRKSHNRVIDFE